MSDETPGTGQMPAGMTLVTTKRLQELVAIEEAARQALEPPAPPSLAERFGRFCLAQEQRDRERRG